MVWCVPVYVCPVCANYPDPVCPSCFEALCSLQCLPCVFVAQHCCVFYIVKSGLVGRCSVLHFSDSHTHTHTHQDGSLGARGLQRPSLTCCVQDFLQDVATKPVPDSLSLSLSLSSFLSLPPRLFVFGERESERETPAERERHLLLI